MMATDSIPFERANGRFASAADLEECLRLHRQYGTTYFFATRLFPANFRRRTHALYGFVRLPDEWVDNPQEDLTATRDHLEVYRAELEAAMRGVRPSYSVLRAFTDVINECEIPVSEPLLFLNAMVQDLTVTRYPSYGDLRDYMRGSASAVGVMMTYILCEKVNPESLPFAMALGEAMQMTNFLRDVAEDAERGRIYLPQEDLARFTVSERDILTGRFNPNFVELMRFEIDRTRDLYRLAEQGIPYLPPRCGKAVRLAGVLYGRILDRIEGCGYNVFETRARTSKGEKIVVAARVLCGLNA